MVRYDRMRLYPAFVISIFKDGGVSLDSEPPDLLNGVGTYRRYERLSRSCFSCTSHPRLVSHALLLYEWKRLDGVQWN
jgi:hypothetical protein